MEPSFGRRNESETYGTLKNLCVRDNKCTGTERHKHVVASVSEGTPIGDSKHKQKRSNSLEVKNETDDRVPDLSVINFETETVEEC